MTEIGNLKESDHVQIVSLTISHLRIEAIIYAIINHGNLVEANQNL